MWKFEEELNQEIKVEEPLRGKAAKKARGVQRGLAQVRDHFQD
jgi:hypothetical protein